MYNTGKLGHKRPTSIVINICLCFLLAILQSNCVSLQQELAPLKTTPLTIDLYHKFKPNEEFKFRGTVLVKARKEYQPASASLMSKPPPLTEADVNSLKEASESNGLYYLKANWRKGSGDKAEILKTTQTIAKSCSLYASNLAETLVINLSPFNDFINVNLFTIDPDCSGAIISQKELSGEFNTTVLVDSIALGPEPDTVTYIKRLEEERNIKAREGKPDDRSFFMKYWYYILPAVFILMMFSGPAEQGAGGR